MTAKEHYEAGLSNYILNTKNKQTLVAYEHFSISANLEYADAYYFLGRFYSLGDGVSTNYQEALSLYEKGLSLGSAKCGYAIALMIRAGYGVKKDEDLAQLKFMNHYEEIKKEADQNDPVSIHIIGTYYYYGLFVQRYVLTAVEWFLKSASLGYSDSQYMLGMIHESSAEDEKAIESAIQYYEEAAKQQHPYAQYALGVYYLSEKIWPKAIKYLEQAANQKYSLAMYTLAMYYHEHEQKQPQKAFNWFLEASNHGHEPSKYYTGLYYQHGRGVTKNIELAIKYYQEAAMKNDKNAQYHLAMIKFQDKDKNYHEIYDLLIKAANQNHPNAQYNLAVMFHKGDGVIENLQKAFEWYEKAAEAGMPMAQYNLGMLYFEGQAVKKDELKALEWWKKAADQGLEIAKKLVVSIENYERLQKTPWQS
jgi:uncharacterized protein